MRSAAWARSTSGTRSVKAEIDDDELPSGPDHQVRLLLEVVESACKEASESVVIDLVVDRDADQGSPLPEANGVAGVPVHEKLEQRQQDLRRRTGPGFWTRRPRSQRPQRANSGASPRASSGVRRTAGRPPSASIRPRGRSRRKGRGLFHRLFHFGFEFLFGRGVEVGVECGEQAFEFVEHERRDFGAHLTAALRAATGGRVCFFDSSFMTSLAFIGKIP